MSDSNNRLAAALGLILSGVLLCPSALATNTASKHPYAAAHLASPLQYQKLAENDQVLVLRMVLKPDEHDVMHCHHNETVYFEHGGTLRISETNTEPVTVEVPDGHLMLHHAWCHQVENVGDNKVVAIIVEQKDAN